LWSKQDNLRNQRNLRLTLPSHCRPQISQIAQIASGA